MIVHKFVNLNDVYAEIDDCILLEEFNYNDADSMNDLKGLLYTEHDRKDSNITDEPSCLCGELSGAYKLGEVCEECNNPVRDDGYHPILWAKSPMFGELGFLNPKMWLLINNLLSNKVDCLKYIADGTYNPKGVPKSLMALVKNREYIRDYKYLIDNFDVILKDIQTILVGEKARIMGDIIEIISQNRDAMYSDYIPILNKKLFVVEKTSVATYVDLNLSNSISMVTQLLKAYGEKDRYKKMQVMVESISVLADSVKSFYRKSLSGKTGGARDKIHIASIPFSGRSVGTSLTFKHRFDEFEMPWKVGLQIFRADILNRLLRDYGYSLKQARKLIIDSYFVYNETIGTIFRQIFKDAPNGVIEFMVLRNPTLEQSSDMLLKCKCVKEDPGDTTIGLSVLLMELFAGDFDGDEYNYARLHSRKMARGFEYMRPATSVMSYQKFGEIAPKINITKASAVILSRKLASEERKLEEDEVEFNNIF